MQTQSHDSRNPIPAIANTPHHHCQNVIWFIEIILLGWKMAQQIYVTFSVLEYDGKEKRAAEKATT